MDDLILPHEARERAVYQSILHELYAAFGGVVNGTVRVNDRTRQMAMKNASHLADAFVDGRVIPMTLQGHFYSPIDNHHHLRSSFGRRILAGYLPQSATRQPTFIMTDVATGAWHATDAFSISYIGAPGTHWRRFPKARARKEEIAHPAAALAYLALAGGARA